MNAAIPAAQPRRQSLPHPECARCLVLSARLAQRPAEPPDDGAVVKRCECGRAYTIQEWRRLARVGLQALIDHDACLDLRDCSGCRSTISLPMRLTPAPEVES